MVAVKAGVVKEPVMPVPPPPDEVQEVLLVDDQVITEVAPLAIEDGTEVRVTVGEVVVITAEETVVEPPPPPHEARPETAKSIANKILSRTLEPIA